MNHHGHENCVFFLENIALFVLCLDGPDGHGFDLTPAHGGGYGMMDTTDTTGEDGYDITPFEKVRNPLIWISFSICVVMDVIIYIYMVKIISYHLHSCNFRMLIHNCFFCSQQVGFCNTIYILIFLNDFIFVFILFYIPVVMRYVHNLFL